MHRAIGFELHCIDDDLTSDVKGPVLSAVLTEVQHARKALDNAIMQQHLTKNRRRFQP